MSRGVTDPSQARRVAPLDDAPRPILDGGGELVFGRFDPSMVRERAENYAVSREIDPFRNGAATKTEFA
jgi:hypothetical protein